MKLSALTCCGVTNRSEHKSRPCSKVANFVVDGRPYCQYHNPYSPRKAGDSNPDGNHPFGLSDLDVLRFKCFVDKSNPDGCWMWTGPTNHKGYGYFQRKNKKIYAHRLSFELAGGVLEGDLCACHKCDTPLCVRPDHIFAGTRLDNVEDCRKKGRQPKPLTHCKRGHELTPDNIVYSGERHRGCRKCRNMGLRARRKALRAALDAARTEGR